MSEHTWVIVLIAGSRDWTDRQRVDDCIQRLARLYDTDLLILEGGCPTGADAFAREVCDARNIPNITMHAHWRWGNMAGPQRNNWMARLQPREAHLFFQRPDSKGTSNMQRCCTARHIKHFTYVP